MGALLTFPFVALIDFVIMLIVRREFSSPQLASFLCVFKFRGFVALPFDSWVNLSIMRAYARTRVMRLLTRGEKLKSFPILGRLNPANYRGVR